LAEVMASARILRTDERRYSVVIAVHEAAIKVRCALPKRPYLAFFIVTSAFLWLADRDPGRAFALVAKIFVDHLLNGGSLGVFCVGGKHEDFRIPDDIPVTRATHQHRISLQFAVMNCQSHTHFVVFLLAAGITRSTAAAAPAVARGRAQSGLSS
jgi:hypothetical protein